MKWLKERRKAPDLGWLEVWMLFILKAAGGGWVGADKIMAVAFLLERIYGGPNGLVKVCFVPGPRSEEVVNALRRLVSLGLVEEQGNAYRLTDEGKAVVESYPMDDVRFRYPYVDVQFFVEWNINSLKEYIRVNYPGWA
jgi:hypothetical protein